MKRECGIVEVHVTDDIIFSSELWHAGTVAAVLQHFFFSFINNEFGAMLTKWLM